MTCMQLMIIVITLWDTCHVGMVDATELKITAVEVVSAKRELMSLGVSTAL